MLTTVLQVIQSGWRRSGLIGQGVVINAKQKDVGLERLQDLFMDLSGKSFGPQHDKYLTTNAAYTAGEFERVFNTAGATVTLPATVRDTIGSCSYDYGFTGGGATRPPLDCCVVTVVVPGVSSHTSIYDSALAQWQRLDGLAIDGECPLSTRWADGLKNLLAVFLVDDVGGQVSPILAKQAASARMALANRYSSERPATRQEYF